MTSLTRPGGTLQGEQVTGWDVSGKQYDSSKRQIHDLRRVGFMTNPKVDSKEEAVTGQDSRCIFVWTYNHPSGWPDRSNQRLLVSARWRRGYDLLRQ